MTEAKAGKYELVAERWDQQTSKVGEPFDFVRHFKGDTVELSKQEAHRLLHAGAVIEPGAREQAAYELALAAYNAALAALPEKPAGSDDESAFPDGDPAESWKLDQLTAYAAANSIDLGDAKLKADIFSKITA